MHRLERYSRHEYIEVAGIPSSTTNDLLEEHVLLIFEKLDVTLEAMDIVASRRLGKTNRVIVKTFESQGFSTYFRKEIQIEEYCVI